LTEAEWVAEEMEMEWRERVVEQRKMNKFYSLSFPRAIVITHLIYILKPLRGIWSHIYCWMVDFNENQP
jgi:hypothetical protein